MRSMTALLLESARRQELHHALILHGSDAVAMRSLALRICKTLNCLESTDGDDCMSCGKIDREHHPDIHWLTPGAERKMISIDQIRAAVGEAGVRPFEGRKKVFIIDPAEGMSIGGANALLKTLEEPTPSTHFILLARSVELLLPTIRSRSQSIAVREGVMENASVLAGRKKISLQAARARVRSGSEGAEEMISEMLELLSRYVEKRETAALLQIAALAASVDDPRDGITAWAQLLRDLVSLSPDDSLQPRAFELVQNGIAPQVLMESAEAALRASLRLVVNADPRLLMEQAVLKLAPVRGPGAGA